MIDKGRKRQMICLYLWGIGLSIASTACLLQGRFRDGALLIIAITMIIGFIGIVKAIKELKDK